MAHLINIIGAPGAGKTYLSEHLAKRGNIYFFDRDILYENVFGVDYFSKTLLWDTEEFQKINKGLTKSLWDVGRANAKNGISSIIESPMTSVLQGKQSDFIDDTLKSSKQRGFDFLLIYCTASEEVIRKNMIKRNAKRDLAKFENWEEFVNSFIDVPGPIYEHLKIDTTSPIKNNLDLIMEKLE